MLSEDERVVMLPVHEASAIDALVASGAYGTASDLIDAGLQACKSKTPTSSAGCGTMSSRSTTPCRPIPPTGSPLPRSPPPSTVSMPNA